MPFQRAARIPKHQQPEKKWRGFPPAPPKEELWPVGSAYLTFITPRMNQPLEAALTTPISIYFDFGIYNAFISECACGGMPSQIAYFDDVRRGVSREEVGTR